MELGSLRQFIDNGHPVDNYAMVGIIPCYFCISNFLILLLQIKGMTDGLAYLHGENVVHGDLKAVSDKNVFLRIFLMLSWRH